MILTIEHFVIGFIFDTQMKNVCLIKKNRPKSWVGLLNGIGGHVESGEESTTALVREVREESGLDTNWSDWTFVTKFNHPTATLLCGTMRNDRFFDAAVTSTDEELVKMSVLDIAAHPKLCVEDVPELMVRCMSTLIFESAQMNRHFPHLLRDMTKLNVIGI